MKIELRSIAAVVSACPLVFALFGVTGVVRAQDTAHEDLTPCPGSAPEPTQSAPWSVAFCNRTGHDVVVEFHDNDCPAKDGSTRGDVYQRLLRRGESRTLPLCYANEPSSKKPSPGVPTLRIPGGKGVTTTWNVVGDCGDRSKPLNLDARTFYDRGEYKTGIILLQYPSGASHCAADASDVASSSGAAGVAPAEPVSTQSVSAPSAAARVPADSAQQAGTAQPQPPAAPRSAVVAPPPPPTIPRSSDSPTLTAVIDSSSVVQHAVQVFAKGGAGYTCNFNLSLTFTDGGSWNDKTKATLTGSEDAPIVTRKYLKSVSKVQITSTKCTRM